MFFGKQKKKKAELDYWRELVSELTPGCTDLAQKQAALLNVCFEITFPRYKKDLYLDDNSFIGKRVLDLCCGPHAGLIGFRDCEKYGVDHLIDSYKELGYPLEKHGIKYFQAKAESLPFADNFFDVIVCVNALDHVDSLKNTLNEASRVLKHSGKFIGQLNFHKNRQIAEPVILDHEKLVAILLKNGVTFTKRVFQYRCGDEDRYYYEFEKL